jgi:hypothetical protein
MEAASIIIVGIGCWGEGWADRHNFNGPVRSILFAGETLKHKWERRFWLMVVWGLALELVAFSFAFTASNNEILDLQAKLQPRTIKQKQADDFIKFTRNVQFKIPISLCVGRLYDDETWNYCRQIDEMLGLAGFQQFQFPVGIEVKTNLHISKHIGQSGVRDVWIFDGNQKNTSEVFYDDISPQSNPELFGNTISGQYAEIAVAVKQMSVAWVKSTNEIFKGDITIYVPPKIY